MSDPRADAWTGRCRAGMPSRPSPGEGREPPRRAARPVERRHRVATRGRRRRPPLRPRRPTPAAPGTFGIRILGVSEVTRAIRGAVRADERLADLWVEGEIGRVTVSSAGHAYFALKDERNQLQCVWFRDDRLRSAFEAQAGLRVVAHGRIDVFEPQGALQLYVESIQPSGLGDLTLRFEALKARLAAEGPVRCRAEAAAADPPRDDRRRHQPDGRRLEGHLHVLGRRWPLARVVLVAAQVQGAAAPASIVTALRKVERYAAALTAAGRPDDAPVVTILARGGGSLEDLWPFNDEAVVRAVVAHGLPGGLRGRPRDRRDPGRLRRRRPRADAVRRGRDRGPGPHRLPGCGPARSGGASMARRGAASGRRRARSLPSAVPSIGSARPPSSLPRASAPASCSIARRGRVEGELGDAPACGRATRGPAPPDRARAAGPRTWSSRAHGRAGCA